jgi:hypothetical protein
VRRLVAVGLVTMVALIAGGCGRAQGMADTRLALERAGYRDVAVSLRTAGGIGYAEVRASTADARPPEQAAMVIWTTLPVRFSTLAVVVGDRTTAFTYEELEGRFGPRDPSLDRRQVDEEVVRSGLKLMVLLSIAAMLSVGAVVGIGFAALRTARRARGGDAQAEGPTSGLGAASLTAEAAGASEEAEEMPS